MISSLHLPIGTTVGDMSIVNTLSSLNTVVVYEAVRDGRPCVLKLVKPIHCSPMVAHQLLNEGVSKLSRLASPLLPLYEQAGVHQDCAWVSMAKLSGAPLSGPLAWEAAVREGVRVARLATRVLQQGLVIVDLKPENLWRCADGSLRVLDLESGALDVREQRRTPAYLAPECFSGALGGEASILYALSLMVAALLHGYHPLDGRANTIDAWRALHNRGIADSVTEVLLLHPEPLRAVIHQGLSLRPNDRGAGIEAWAERLEGLLPPESPVSGVQLPRRPSAGQPAQGTISFAPPPPDWAVFTLRPGAAPGARADVAGAATRTPDFALSPQLLRRQITEDLLASIPAFPGERR